MAICESPTGDRETVRSGSFCPSLNGDRELQSRVNKGFKGNACSESQWFSVVNDFKGESIILKENQL